MRSSFGAGSGVAKADRSRWGPGWDRAELALLDRNRRVGLEGTAGLAPPALLPHSPPAKHMHFDARFSNLESPNDSPSRAAAIPTLWGRPCPPRVASATHDGPTGCLLYIWW
jgi:hypothetical protein